MNIIKKGLALAKRRVGQACFNNRILARTQPLRINNVSSPTTDCHLQVEAYTALFFQCYKSKTIIDAHDNRRLEAYCTALGVSLSRKYYVSPFQIQCSPDYLLEKSRLKKSIEDLLSSNPDHEYLAAFVNFVEFAYEGKPLPFEEADYRVVEAGAALTSGKGRCYTFSVFDCAVVIIKSGNQFTLAHMKIGHAFTPRAQASLGALMDSARSLDADQKFDAFVIADNPGAVGRMVGKALKDEARHGSLYLHQKSPLHCASVSAEINDGDLKILSEVHAIDLLKWPGWSEITGIMPASQIATQIRFFDAGEF